MYVRPGLIAFCSAKPCKTVQKKLSPRRRVFFYFFKQPQCLAPAGQSWAEAGSGVRNWSSPASSGVQAQEKGRGVLDAEAGLRGGAAACGAAAAAGAQRELLRLRGVIHVVGGPDVLHGRVLAALLGPAPSPCRVRGRRLRRLQAQRPAPLPPRQLPPRQPAFPQPRPRWAPG